MDTGLFLGLAFFVVGTGLTLAVARWGDRREVRHWCGIGAYVCFCVFIWLVASYLLGLTGMAPPRALLITGGLLAFGSGVFLPQISAIVGFKDAALSLHVEIPNAIVYDGPGQRSLFMAEYQSLYGQTVSPVFHWLYFTITNAGSHPVKVRNYSVEVSASADGPWNRLQQFAFSSTAFYSIGVAPAAVNKIIAFPSGTYRLATEMPDTALRQARRVVVESLDGDLTQAIGPHSEAKGWAAYDIQWPNDREARRYYRVTIRDNVGRSSTWVLQSYARAPGDHRHDVAMPGLMLAGKNVDLSHAHVCYASELSKR